MKISGRLVDIHKREIYYADLFFENGIITSINKTLTGNERFILPGLIDAHVHIESSMVTPGAFAEEAVRHGTVGVVSDPHEIGNVLGIAGVKYMIEDASKVPLRFWFGAPSCVPATGFEISGAEIKADDVESLLEMEEIKYLSEMMNYPGVIYNDQEVLRKISAAKKLGKPVDGHAPGITGDTLRKYVEAGISTDHECSTIEEAIEKLDLGMKVLIREGSAARNLEALKTLIKSHPEMIMLCSDDLHPEMLVKRHLNILIAELLLDGYDLYDLLRSCTINPVNHYNLESGLLREGDSADFIIVDDYMKMNISETWIKGRKVYDRGEVLFKYSGGSHVNNFNCSPISTEDISVVSNGTRLNVILTTDGELLTKRMVIYVKENELIKCNPVDDILKIVVKNRYTDAPAVTGFIKGFGLKEGAFASSVAHDSHNIICVGTSDEEIVAAINEVVRTKGGLSVSSAGITRGLSLPIGGIMSDKPCREIAADYESLCRAVNTFGSKLKAPFMTLSFMALLVIPELKIGDKGLFDGNKFSITPLFDK